MKKRTISILSNQLLLAFIILLFSCKPNSVTPTIVVTSQPDNNYAYSLIEENSGWHIFSKDSMDNNCIGALPGNIFFANNSIYYSNGIYMTYTPNQLNYVFKKCNLDGSSKQVSTFLSTYTGGSNLPFVFDNSSTEYSFLSGGSLKQQTYNADGTLNGSSVEIMGYNSFAGKFKVPTIFSPAAHCFMGGGYGYTDVIEVQNTIVKPYMWAISGRSDIPFNPNPVFDEGYCKANPNHYRIFGASIGRDNIHAYTNNPCDIAVHCMMDTAKANNFGYPSTYYANAVLMDTIHYEPSKFASQLISATDDQNLYVFAINTDKSGTIIPASLIIYDKNSFIKKKYYPNIAIPSTVSKDALKSICKVIAIPSKNYLAIFNYASMLIKLDLSTGITTDITPAISQWVSFGGGLFENNGRIYSQVAGKIGSSGRYCSNIIYYE